MKPSLSKEKEVFAIVNRYFKQMQNINEKRCEAAEKELNFCTMESKIFSNFAQSIHELENKEC